MPSRPAGWSAYYRIIRRIPRGRVSTYGGIALLAGKPRAGRQVGFALAALRGSRDAHEVPWQRVLGQRPRGMAGISILDAMGAGVQRALLEKEGVELDERGRVDLARYGWPLTPALSPGSRRRRGGKGRPASRRASGGSSRSRPRTP